MRKQMRGLTEESLKEQQVIVMSERNQHGDRLFQKWANKKNVGKGMDKIYEASPNKARNLAFVLENQEKHLKNLTETQISSVFSTAPVNVIKVIRLSYPNSVRGEIFLEWGMETARDVIFYLRPIYNASKRDATNQAYMIDSFANRYASEIDEDTLGTGDGSTLAFRGPVANNLSVVPVVPFSVKVFVDNVPVATDDGSGNLVGSLLSTTTPSTVNYTTGSFWIYFAGGHAPASGVKVVAQYFHDSEQSSLYAQNGEVELTLQDYVFRVKPWPLGVSWSKMTEILLGTTLDIDAEEALLQGAADELKKSLDFQSLKLGWQYAKGNNPVVFSADFALAGADSEVAHAQSVTKVFDQAGDVILNAVNRGGVSKIYGGPSAINFIKLHNRFTSAGAQPKIGAHKVGSLDGIDIYKTPSAIVPGNEIVCVWKNEVVDTDASILFGTLIPLYHTQTLEYRYFYKETGIAYFGDFRVTNPQYLVRCQFTGI